MRCGGAAVNGDDGVGCVAPVTGLFLVGGRRRGGGFERSGGGEGEGKGVYEVGGDGVVGEMHWLGCGRRIWIVSCARWVVVRRDCVGAICREFRFGIGIVLVLWIAQDENALWIGMSCAMTGVCYIKGSGLAMAGWKGGRLGVIFEVGPNVVFTSVCVGKCRRAGVYLILACVDAKNYPWRTESTPHRTVVRGSSAVS